MTQMNIIVSLFTPYLKMAVINKKGENVNVYHAGFDDAKSVLDEHELNQVKEQDKEKLR